MAYTTVYLGDQRCIVADTFAELPTTDDIVIGTPAKVGKNDYTLSQDRTWVQTSFGGAKSVSNDWSNQSWPEDRYDQSTATAGDALDNTAFGAVTDQELYEGVIFIDTTAECTMQITLDGTTWIAADHPFIDLGVAARTIVTTTNANTGPFLMNTPCKGFRFLNDGAAACTVTYAQVGKVGI